MTTVTTTRVSRVVVFACVAVALASTSASAQSVTDVLTFLVTNQSVSTGSVERDREAAQATSITISRALAANLATLPVTSSSGCVRVSAEPGARNGGACDAELRTVFHRAGAERRPRPGILRPDAAAAALHVARRPKPARRLAGHDGEPVHRRDGAVRRRPADAEHRRERRDALCQRRGDGSARRRHRRAARLAVAGRIARQHLSRPHVHAGDGERARRGPGRSRGALEIHAVRRGRVGRCRAGRRAAADGPRGGPARRRVRRGQVLRRSDRSNRGGSRPTPTPASASAASRARSTTPARWRSRHRAACR